MAKDPIHIKPENKGKFTRTAERAGRTVKQEESAVLKSGSKASPALKKEAQFAKNASKWNKK
jgi:hypothetical protein